MCGAWAIALVKDGSAKQHWRRNNLVFSHDGSGLTVALHPDSSGEFVISGEVGTPATPSPVTNPWASAAEAESRSFASRRISDEMKSFPSADTVYLRGEWGADRLRAGEASRLGPWLDSALLSPPAVAAA